MIQVEEENCRLAIDLEQFFRNLSCANSEYCENYFLDANAGLRMQKCDIYFGKLSTYFKFNTMPLVRTVLGGRSLMIANRDSRIDPR